MLGVLFFGRVSKICACIYRIPLNRIRCRGNINMVLVVPIVLSKVFRIKQVKKTKRG